MKSEEWKVKNLAFFNMLASDNIYYRLSVIYVTIRFVPSFKVIVT